MNDLDKEEWGYLIVFALGLISLFVGGLACRDVNVETGLVFILIGIGLASPLPKAWSDRLVKFGIIGMSVTAFVCYISCTCTSCRTITILLPDLAANATNHSSPAIGYNATVCWSYAMQTSLASFNQSSLNATAEHLKLILSAFQVDPDGGAPQKLLSKIFGW
jgi:hypothetical protein